MTATQDSSRPLKKAKHERFAAFVAGGMPVSDAFVHGGYPANPGNARRLAGKPEVRARIEFLKNQTTGRMLARIEDAGARKAEAAADEVIAAKVSREHILELLMENALIAMGKVPVTVIVMVKKKRKTDDGGFEEVVEAAAVEVTERNAGAANRALELYGKAIGEPFDGTAVADKPIMGRIINMSKEELHAYAQKLAEEMTELGVNG